LPIGCGSEGRWFDGPKTVRLRNSPARIFVRWLCQTLEQVAFSRNRNLL